MNRNRTKCAPCYAAVHKGKELLEVEKADKGKNECSGHLVHMTCSQANKQHVISLATVLVKLMLDATVVL